MHYIFCTSTERKLRMEEQSKYCVKSVEVVSLYLFFSPRTPPNAGEMEVIRNAICIWM